MIVSPSVTCPSPASAARPSLRTSRTVVLRILVDSLGMFVSQHYRNSLEGKSRKRTLRYDELCANWFESDNISQLAHRVETLILMSPEIHRRPRRKSSPLSL